MSKPSLVAQHWGGRWHTAVGKGTWAQSCCWLRKRSPEASESTQRTPLHWCRWNSDSPLGDFCVTWEKPSANLSLLSERGWLFGGRVVSHGLSVAGSLPTFPLAEGLKHPLSDPWSGQTAPWTLPSPHLLHPPVPLSPSHTPLHFPFSRASQSVVN